MVKKDIKLQFYFNIDVMCYSKARYLTQSFSNKLSINPTAEFMEKDV